MDIQFFLLERLRFIRQLYVTTTSLYEKRKEDIRSGNPPYQITYVEDDRLPYVDDWIEAEESVQAIGNACLSMLSSALKLYFQEWERKSGLRVPENAKGQFREIGWVAGYVEHFQQAKSISPAVCPADMDLLRELVLVRNRIEHPDNLATNRTMYEGADLKKLTRPYFINQDEVDLFGGMEGAEEEIGFFTRHVEIRVEKIDMVVKEITRLSEWLELGMYGG